MTQTKIPWKNNGADKKIMLQILEQEASKLKNKDLRDGQKSIGRYDYWKNTLSKNKKYQYALENAYNNHEYYPAENIIKLMPDEYKRKKQYTWFLDSCLQKLYERWNTVGSIDVTQMMLVHHPIKEIKMTGLEIMIANNIGTGSANDLTWIMCQMTDCKFIVTGYIDQEYHGYRQADPYCPSHGNLLYTADSRLELKKQWDHIINKYVG